MDQQRRRPPAGATLKDRFPGRIRNSAVTPFAAKPGDTLGALHAFDVRGRPEKVAVDATCTRLGRRSGLAGALLVNEILQALTAAHEALSGHFVVWFRAVLLSRCIAFEVVPRTARVRALP